MTFADVHINFLPPTWQDVILCTIFMLGFLAFVYITKDDDR